MFKIIRIYDFIKSQYRDDFYGVFIDRLYPRGIKKEIFNSFLRLKEISPSNKLRAWFHEDKEARFQEFKTEFKKELKTPEAIKALKTLKELEKTHKNIALLTAAKDTEHCHAPVILEALKSYDKSAADNQLASIKYR